MQEIKSKRLSFLARFCTLFAGLTLGSAVVAAAPASPSAALGPTPHVALKTSMGEIVLELDQEKAPQSVANFLQYVNSGYYKGTVFHRVIDGFMIQGGGRGGRRGNDGAAQGQAGEQGAEARQERQAMRFGFLHESVLNRYFSLNLFLWQKK